LTSLARTIPAQSTEIVHLQRPFSNFQFVEERFEDLWPLRRILSQVRQLGGKTMVLESVDGAQDILEENEDIRSLAPSFKKTATFRLSFFTRSVGAPEGISELAPEDFIGFAILKDDHVPKIKGVSRSGRGIARVYESALRTSSHKNNYVRGAPSWQCRAGTEQFAVSAYLYAQQNSVTNCCAHVALRTVAARFHPRGDVSYRMINEWVAKTRGKKRWQECAVHEGLGKQEVAGFLEQVGARCFQGDFTLKQRPPVPFQKYIYGSVESGYPAIVAFTVPPGRAGEEEPVAHAIPVFGHTFNEDIWVPNAASSYFKIGTGTEYLPSELWVSMYVCHDDNWGSNFCIPRRYLYTRRLCGSLPEGPDLCPETPECVGAVIGCLPGNVKTNPIQAEAIAADYLLKMLPHIPKECGAWAERLKYYAEEARNRAILRPLLVTGEQYADHLGKVRDWNRSRLEPGLTSIFEPVAQDYFWMVELSVPELFSANHRKVGEILLRSNVDPGKKRDFRMFAFARLPGYFAFLKGADPTKPQYEFLPTGLRGHVELYGCEE